MIAASFIAGFLAGIAALLCFALWWVRSQPEAMRRDNRIAAVGLSMNGNGAISVDAHTAYQLREVFKHLESGKA